MIYKLRIGGHQGQQWTDRFEGLTIMLEGSDSLPTVPVVDGTALRGLQKKVHDLGMALLAVNRVESGNIKSEKEEE